MGETLQGFLKTRAEYRDANKRARLSFLYSDLSQVRSRNPAGFTSSISWWSSLVTDVVAKGLQDGGGEAADSSNKLVWHLDQAFVDSLRWEGTGRPTCLGTIAIHLSQATPSQIIPFNVFMKSQKPVEYFSWPRWMLSKLVAAPLWWSMGKLGIVDSDGGMSEEKAWKLAQGDWVVMDNLNRAADAIGAMIDDNTGIISRLYTLESFAEAMSQKALPGVRLTEQDVKVVLKYLQRDRRLLVQDEEVIKMLLPEERSAVSAILEAEKGILQVKLTNTALEKQIEDLEKRIAERQAKVAQYVKSGQKGLAISHLRSKKALLDVLSKRTLAQENLTEVLLRIEAAETDVSVLSAYTAATASLKSLLSHPSLQRENVENTMDALQDALADQKEIEDIVTDVGKQASGMDVLEEEVKEELEALEKEAKNERQKKEDAEQLERKLKEAENLPTVPTEEAKEKGRQEHKEAVAV